MPATVVADPNEEFHLSSAAALNCIFELRSHLQSIVSAASRAVLLMLTIEPLSPVALVKILTVFPAPSVKVHCVSRITCVANKTHSIKCGFTHLIELNLQVFELGIVVCDIGSHSLRHLG